MCWPCVFSKPWLHMALAPELQLWEELSPGQERLGAGDSAAVLSKGCRARCRSRARSQLCFPEPAAAEKHLQQPRALAREPSPCSPACCEIAAAACGPQEELAGFQESEVSKGHLLAPGPSL